MPEKSSPAPSLEDRVAELQAQVAALLEAGADTATSAAERVRANGHAAVNTAREGAETAVLRVADEVRTHPIASVVLAIAVGWAVGRFVSR